MPRSSTVPGLLALLVLGGVSLAAAQSLPFRTYSSDDGLAESVVLALYQDSNGFLWLGTPAGASRFDGLELTTFDDSNALPNDVVRGFLEDAHGDLWVATDGGLGRLRGDTWQRLGPDEGLPEAGSRCLVEDDEGRIWIGTWGGGLVRLEADGSPTLFGTEDGLAHERVRACYRDHQDRLWFGTWGGGLSLRTTEGFRNYAAADGLADTHVRALAEDAEGRLLVGTNEGVYRLEDQGFAPLPPAVEVGGDSASLAQATITSLHLARDGRLWLGTRDHGACRWRPDELRCFSLEDGLPDNSINAILEDREGNLWFGTFGGGASRLAGEGVLNYSARDGLPNASVQAFAQVGDELWIGTHGGGVSRLGPEGLRATLTTAEGLPHDKVVAVAGDPDGGVWLGTLEGAAHWRRDGRLETYLPAQGLAHRTVLDILPEGDGTVWFGTLEGLSRLSPEGTMVSLGLAEGLPGARVNHILPARDGGKWLATEGGLAYFDGVIRQTWTQAEGLSDGYVNRLLERPDGLWIATASGLDHLRDGVLRSYGPADGLSHEKCTVLLEDPGGRLWIGTTRGINVFENGRFSAFSNRDGLLSSEVNPGAGLLDRRGRLWFGTVRGASVFEPDAALRQVPPPELLLIRAEAGGERLDTGRRDLEISHHANTLRFDYVGLSLSYPEGVIYEVQLEGYDPGPRTTRARQVEYAALAPGDYTFRARARHRGAWGEAVELAFVISPPFHQTLWFRTLGVMLTLALALLVHRLRLRRIERRSRRLEELVAERTAEVRQERHHVRRQNDLLETTNLIVQQINAELELDSLLRTILEGACFLAAADCALALVRQGGSGGGTRTSRGARPLRRRHLQVAVDLHWPGAPRNPPPIEEDTVQRALLDGTTTLGEGLYYGEGSLRTLPETLGRCPQSYAVMSAELDGEAAGYVVIGKTRDDFEDEELEALRRLQAHVVSTFVKGRTLDALQRLNNTKDEFLGMAAHDLRSPLGGVKSYTDLLLRLLEEDRLEKPLGRKFLSNMRTTVEQMLTLVEDLLDVTSIETGRIELRLAPYPMAELLAEHLAFHQRAAAEKNITLDVESIPGDVLVEADRVRLGEVLDNLLTNAVKYTPEGGTVRVHCTFDDTTVRTHVEDNGQGLPPEEVALVFTGRKLSARPTAGEKSTGLGLVIAKRLVDLHGGTIEASSQLGQGSTFTFGLRRWRGATES